MIDITLQKSKGFIPQNISRDQARDTGMAMVLLCLLIGTLGRKQIFVGMAIPVLLVNMIWPNFYKPVAKIWLGLSHALGTVMSKIVLTLLFVFMVTPMGLARRMWGSDSLKLREWKRGRGTVFRVRDHVFTDKDLKAPY